ERAPRQEGRPAQPVAPPPPTTAAEPVTPAPIRKPISQPASIPKPTAQSSPRRAGRDTPIIG
ncbi:MAG: hypothetical protein AAB346_02945, partial [Pseudomonadota bacterium]